MDLSTREHKEYYKYTKYNKTLLFYVPNGPCLFRAMTLETKEPWTLEWIRSFNPNDVLWDVGANIGIYSIYAALMMNTKVYAFEPEAANYNVLNENIRINKIQHLVKAYCIAISDQNNFGELSLSKVETAASGHQFGGRGNVYKQGCISFSLDHLYDLLPSPTHIKIDVDGLEPLIISGGLNKLLPNVKSIMIEVCDRKPGRLSVKDTLIDLGFKWHSDVAERSTHKRGRFKGVGEHLFTR